MESFDAAHALGLLQKAISIPSVTREEAKFAGWLKEELADAAGPTKPAPGDSVVFGFRPQAFVTRAFVAGVSGLSTQKPVVESISHSSGAKAHWPP